MSADDLRLDLLEQARFYASLTHVSGLGLPSSAGAIAPAAALAGPAAPVGPPAVVDTAGERDLFGQPLPRAGRRTTPVGLQLDTPAAADEHVPPSGAPAFEGLDAPARLAAVREWLGDCRRCKLADGRKTIVFGQGHPEARLMFVGEAPGADEDEQGLAFVGRAGQLLTRIIEAIELTRDQVFIANVLKCRPPGNRNPEPDEILACQPFLERQIAALQPRVIVALGKFACQFLLKTAEPITRLRGRMGSYRGVAVMPTYHPAYLLRNPGAKREVWEDMKVVRDLLRG